MNRQTKKTKGNSTNSKSERAARSSNRADYTILSNRERQILLGLANGSLYKEIAEECGISIDTVKKHCKNIYRKLDARNRTEAIQKSGAFEISFKKMK